MRIESSGIKMQSFKNEANTGIDDNEAFSEIIDEVSDEMSKNDVDAEHTKPMNDFLSETQISLGLKKGDMFPVVFPVEELSYLRAQNYGDGNQNLINKAINAYNSSMGIYG